MDKEIKFKISVAVIPSASLRTGSEPVISQTKRVKDPLLEILRPDVLGLRMTPSSEFPKYD
jgi:hypothetical protein